MIFVTGGTGFLGNCVVRELLHRGEPVRVLCRPTASHECFEGLEVEIVQGDLGDAELLRQAVQGCRAVVHCAAMIHIGWHRMEQSRSINVEGTRRLALTCADQGIRLVHVSTVDTLPAARNAEHPVDELAQHGVQKVPCAYVVTKREAEQVVRELVACGGLDAVILHPGFMLGPYDWKPSSGRMLLEVSRLPVVAAPSGGCSVCDARDVAAGVANAIEMGECGESYILAGENISYQELWSQILRAAGRSRRVFRLGPGVHWFGRAVDIANRLLPIQERDVNGAMIAMGSLQHFYSSNKASQRLSYRTRSVEETLRDAWEWLSQRHIYSKTEHA